MSQLMGYKQYPVYYKHMAPSNLLPLGAPPASELPLLTTLDEVGDATIIDVGPFEDYAAGHLPGCLSFQMSTDDAVYMGWTLPWNSPVVLVGTKPQVEEVRVHLQRIGWDDVVGRIDPDSLGAMVDGPLATTAIMTFADLGDDARNILDVRDPVEHQVGVIPGATLAHLAEVAKDPKAYAADEVLVHCQSGYRAGIAAGFLEAAGVKVTVIRDDLDNYRGSLTAP